MACVFYSKGDTGIPGLRHFLYKSRTHVQFTMPELTDPYTSLSAKKRLLRQYKHMNDRMHRKARPLKLVFHSSEHETMLGWVMDKTISWNMPLFDVVRRFLHGMGFSVICFLFLTYF